MKKVLITGGNGDIAKAIVDAMNIVGGFEVYAPSKEELDVSDQASVQSYIERVIPDILINNAGYIHPFPIASDHLASDKRAIDINLFGVFNCTNAVLLKNKNALIVNIGSSAGTKSHANWSSYCATKAAVIMATQCWAEEGIKAICISPGRTATKMREFLFPQEDKQTLLTPQKFASVVMRAIGGEFTYGSNIDVNINNTK